MANQGSTQSGFWTAWQERATGCTKDQARHLVKELLTRMMQERYKSSREEMLKIQTSVFALDAGPTMLAVGTAVPAWGLNRIVLKRRGLALPALVTLTAYTMGKIFSPAAAVVSLAELPAPLGPEARALVREESINPKILRGLSPNLPRGPRLVPGPLWGTDPEAVDQSLLPDWRSQDAQQQPSSSDDAYEDTSQSRAWHEQAESAAEATSSSSTASGADPMPDMNDMAAMNLDWDESEADGQDFQDARREGSLRGRRHRRARNADPDAQLDGYFDDRWDNQSRPRG